MSFIVWLLVKIIYSINNFWWEVHIINKVHFAIDGIDPYIHRLRMDVREFCVATGHMYAEVPRSIKLAQHAIFLNFNIFGSIIWSSFEIIRMRSSCQPRRNWWKYVNDLDNRSYRKRDRQVGCYHTSPIWSYQYTKFSSIYLSMIMCYIYLNTSPRWQLSELKKDVNSKNIIIWNKKLIREVTQLCRRPKCIVFNRLF